jgi:CBS domain-containing protein
MTNKRAEQKQGGTPGYEDHGESELKLGPNALGKPPQQCRDIMTKEPLCGLASDTVEKIAQLMKREDIGPVPIVDDQQTKKLVGIVTDRDLAIKVVAEGRNPQRTTVEEVMTHNPVTCRPEDQITQALQAMTAYQIRRIPVVTTDSRVVGIIAQADVATRLEEPRTTAEVVEEISQPTPA